MEDITIKAELLLILESKQDWINKVPKRLSAKTSKAEEWIWVDAKGHTMALGEDFSAAQTMKTYPVKVYKLVRAYDALLQSKKVTWAGQKILTNEP